MCDSWCGSLTCQKNLLVSFSYIIIEDWIENATELQKCWANPLSDSSKTHAEQAAGARETGKCAAAGSYARLKRLFEGALHELLERGVKACEKNVHASHC
jgi:hypothetical protein